MYLFLTLALAQELPPLVYRPEVAGEGRGLHLVDLSGQELPTDQALQMLGMTEEAAQWTQRTRVRRGVAAALYGSGGLVLVGLPLLEGTVGTGGVASLTPIIALSLVCSGWVVHHGRLDAHLGGWIREQPLRMRLAAQSQVSDPSDPKLQADRLLLLAEEMYTINDRGVLVQSFEEVVDLEELLRVRPDPEVEAAYRRSRRWDKVLWIPIMALGSGASAVGLGLLAITILPDVQETPEMVIGGLGVVSGGLGVVGIGVTGMVISGKIHNSPSHWYSAEELEEIRGEREYELRYRLQLPSRSMLEVYPVIGPGMVGFTGVF